MENYQNRGQGTLNSIIALVLFFLIIDVVIGFLIYFDIKIDFLNQNKENPKVTVTTTIPATDNSSMQTDNT